MRRACRRPPPPYLESTGCNVVPRPRPRLQVLLVIVVVAVVHMAWPMLFCLRDGNNPSDGDFNVGIVERCMQCLGVVGW